MKIKYLLLAIGFSAITGCASNDSMSALDIEKERQEFVAERNEVLEANIDDLPKWVVDSPKSDSEGMYAVGVGESDNLALALKKARLEAEFGLAKLYSQELSGSERKYSSDSSNATSDRYVGLIDKLVKQVPIVGYSTAKQKIKAVDGKYQTYVLLKLPYDAFNSALKQQREEQTADDMATAFDELERRLDMRRNQSL